jgi:hypothetical protein
MPLLPDCDAKVAIVGRRVVDMRVGGEDDQHDGGGEGNHQPKHQLPRLGLTVGSAGFRGGASYEPDAGHEEQPSEDDQEPTPPLPSSVPATRRILGRLTHDAKLTYSASRRERPVEPSIQPVMVGVLARRRGRDNTQKDLAAKHLKASARSGLVLSPSGSELSEFERAKQALAAFLSTRAAFTMAPLDALASR